MILFSINNFYTLDWQSCLAGKKSSVWRDLRYRGYGYTVFHLWKSCYKIFRIFLIDKSSLGLTMKQLQLRRIFEICQNPLPSLIKTNYSLIPPEQQRCFLLKILSNCYYLFHQKWGIGRKYNQLRMRRFIKDWHSITHMKRNFPSESCGSNLKTDSLCWTDFIILSVW